VIRSFASKETEKLFRGRFSAKLPQDVQRIAQRKLKQVNGAATLDFLRVPPGNRLEQLSGNRNGQWSIRINDQWRICFRWEEGNAHDVEITDEGDFVMVKRDLPPVHPGEILLEDFLKPMGITRYRLAKSIGVPQRRVDEICAGKRSVTADTALRLARFFGADAQSWMNLQAEYDLEIAEITLAERIVQEVKPLKEAA
jgi:addiction module HigA family antidote